MCDQSPSQCKMSIKVVFLNNPELEEEWYGCLYYLWLGSVGLLILHGEINERIMSDLMKCPLCQKWMIEKHGGLYCLNKHCPAFGNKTVACCEGGAC